MELTLTSTLALFVLITLSTVVFFASKRIRWPYTVLLVLVGLIMVPIINLPYFNVVFGFIGDMVLTPELLFFIFLPVLIFESGFNMNIRKMLDNAWAISLLAVVSVMVSAVVTAALMYWLLPLIGIQVPFIIALMFGAVIASTDPAAVLSLFKELGVPPRLSMIFEGECLLNDGTAIALFFVFLGIAVNGFNGAETVFYGVMDFFIMLFFGTLIGLVLAAAFSRAVRFTRQNEFVTVTLLVISAHLVFIFTELINSWGYVHVSSIIATAVASLFLGNYARSLLEPKTDEYLGKLIEHMAFVVNSLVFLMAGLLFASSGVDLKQLWLPILVTVLIVATARFVSVYMVILPLNWSHIEEHIPAPWRKLLAWGSLRGALSIIVVLIIPADFTIAGWDYSFSPRDFLLALTIGCVLATLFIKAPLIAPIMRRYNVNQFDPAKSAYEADMSVYYMLTERQRLESHYAKGFFSQAQYERLHNQVEQRMKNVKQRQQSLLDEFGNTVFVQSMHMAMVSIEMTTLKRLYLNDEIGEKTYRKLHGKLSLQLEKIEYAQYNNIDPGAYSDRKDIFDRLVNFVQHIFSKKPDNQQLLEEKLQYYRAQMIIARKAVVLIERMQEEFGRAIFMPAIYEQVSFQYKTYHEQSKESLEQLMQEHPEELSGYRAQLAERSLTFSGYRALHYLHDVGLVNEAIEKKIHNRFDV